MSKKIDALLLTEECGRFAQLKADLSGLGINCSVATYAEYAAAETDGGAVDLLLVSVNGHNGDSKSYASILDDADEKRAPVIALLSKEALLRADSLPNMDDFVVEPWNAAELAARARRLIRGTRHTEGHDLITCGELVIDLNECEVYVGNKRIDLQRLEGKGKSLWHKPAKCANAHTNSYDAIRPGRSRPFLYRPQQLPRYNAFVHDGNLPSAIAVACPTANPPSFIGTRRGT